MVKTSASNLQKAVWNGEEDENLVAYSSKQRGTGNWTTSSKRSGQRRSGKISRERWSSNQKSDLKLKSFTPQEEELVIQLHSVLGSRWHIIALQIPEKTENDVKFLWNSKLKKKLSAMGIDPVTHRPFSQILADYGSMGAFPKARMTRLTSLSRDLKSAFVFKHEQQPHTAAAVKKPELYSQLEAINLVTEASKQQQQQHYNMNECASSSPPPESSFSWSDFFLEEAFAEQENAGQFVQCDDDDDDEGVKGLDKMIDGGGGGGGSSFDASSSSSSSNTSAAFVEAMIGKQDEMCSHLPCFYEEPFY